MGDDRVHCQESWTLFTKITQLQIGTLKGQRVADIPAKFARNPDRY
jgi:hypothetical protein